MNIYFGKNLKQLRAERNLTQERLADFLGVSFQTISKWERDDSYPDISMLPVIASFFKVSVDDLLGVKEAENEEKIQQYLYEAGCLSDRKAAFEIIKKAVKEFPSDFRIIEEYLFELIANKGSVEDGMSILSEVRTIYDNIQKNCTIDSIRISSKMWVAEYYKTLTRVENSGITLDDVKDIVESMPSIISSREHLQTFIYPIEGEAHYNACRVAIDQLIYMLNGEIYHYCVYDDNYPIEFKIKAIEKMLDVQNSFNEDRNFGKSWRSIVYNYGHLGHMYFEIGNTEKAIENLRKSAELAKQFDELPQISERHSLFFEGSVFDKNTLGSTYVACSRMKYLMTEKYPLSDEFKDSREFKEIIEILS